MFETIEFLAEVGDVLERAIHRRVAHVADMVELAQLGHHQVADPARRQFAFGGHAQLSHHRAYCRFDALLGNRPLVQRAVEAGAQLACIEGLAPTIVLDDRRQLQFHGFDRRKALAARRTLAKTLSGIVIDQQRKLMEPQRRVKDVLANGGDWIEVRGHKKHIKGYLKEFLFDPGIADAPIGSLSGGERSRLLLAREFARAANLLVLDEPTNDLDLETLDLLQEVIADYEGTVLIVSHDRDFLDRTVTITLGLDGSGKVDIVAGGYEDWVRKRYEAHRTPVKAEAQAAAKPARDRAPEPRPSPGSKLSYKDQRDYDRLPDEIERLQAAVAADEETLSDPDLYTRDPKRFAELTERIARHRADIETAELRWLEVAEMAEQLAR